MTLNVYLDDFFKKVGIGENTLVNNMKKRNIRIQLCMKGVDLEKMGSVDITNHDLKTKVDGILKSLNL